MNWIERHRQEKLKRLWLRIRWVSMGLILIWPIVSSCASAPDITGRWQEVGAQATLDFRPDGTFTAVDNLGMAVSGTYQLQASGGARFDIAHPGGAPETIMGRISLRGDRLSIFMNDDGEREHYRRVP